LQTKGKDDEIKEIKKGEKFMEKKFFKCKICGDVHFGAAGPEICPTCKQKNAYDEISKDAAGKDLKFSVENKIAVEKIAPESSKLGLPAKR